MKILITENDRFHSFRAAIYNVATHHQINNTEFKTNEELYNEIVGLDSPLLEELTNYLTAYNRWFDFYINLKQNDASPDKEYILDKNQDAELNELTYNRTNTLEILQNRYDELRA